MPSQLSGVTYSVYENNNINHKINIMVREWGIKLRAKYFNMVRDDNNERYGWLMITLPTGNSYEGRFKILNSLDEEWLEVKKQCNEIFKSSDGFIKTILKSDDEIAKSLTGWRYNQFTKEGEL